MIQFQYPYATFMIIPVVLAVLYYFRPKGTKAILLVASRLVVISIILLSIASPYTEEYVQGMTATADITIIADRTESMRLFPPPDEIYGYLSNRTPTAIDYISGTSSPIGDAIIRNIRPEGSILLISDGNNNYGRSIPDAVSFARSLNTTVYYLRQEAVKKDMSVSIEGDAAAFVDKQADFNVIIRSTGDIEGDLNVRIDGKIIYSDRINGSRQIPLEYSFGRVGSHEMKAELAALDDEFPQNNVFYRSVHVAPRPQVLLVSDKDSPLSQVMKSSYSVYTVPSPADASRYKAVVLDDVGAADLSFSDTLILSDYVINGGGLVVVGGPDAYSDYNKLPLFEQLIPVKYGGVPPISPRTAVVIIVDISGSTGDISGDKVKLGVEKGLALQVLDDLGAADFIGVIAFNNAHHTVVPFAQYSERSGAQDAIQRLRYGGTTHLSPALAAAQEMLRNFDGGRNVIVISDGAVADSDASLKTASSMSDDGITIYAIGVGGDTDVEFMTQLAEAGGGGYLRRDAAHGIKLLFSEKEIRKSGEGYPLLIINNGHFITQDGALNATVYGYNNVHSKQNAQVLVMTGNGNPVVTTWRAGLGRVVAITVDNGNAWAPALYSEGNSKLVMNSINYAVGTPDGFELRAQDGEAGEPIDVFVSSESEPLLEFENAKLQFEKTGEKQYHTLIYPNSAGFHNLSGYTIAVNERSEYRNTGNNELIPGIITGAGGQVYNISELERLISDNTFAKTGRVRKVVYLEPVFLLAALSLYSIEVVIRRIMELLR